MTMEKVCGQGLTVDVYVLSDQRTLTVRGRITVLLGSCLTRFDSTASLNTNNIIFSSLIKSNLIKLKDQWPVL